VRAINFIGVLQAKARRVLAANPPWEGHVDLRGNSPQGTPTGRQPLRVLRALDMKDAERRPWRRAL
jgi:hypothetical protein